MKRKERKDTLRKEARTLSTLYLVLFLPFQVSLQEFNLFLQIYHKYLNHTVKFLLLEPNFKYPLHKPAVLWFLYTTSNY